MSSWDERYKQGLHAKDEPHPLVLEYVSRRAAGRALDLACGPGRHALFLAHLGWHVTAVDSSAVATVMLRNRSRKEGLQIEAHLADLERHEFAVPPDTYDLIVICNYLQRDLFRAARAGTRIGGLIIAIVAMIDDDPSIKPMNPDYLVAPGELRAQFVDCELIHDFEGKRAEGARAMAEIVARKVN